jgi:CTP:molybdopterin cytidylyltransferase MocA
MNFILLAAGHGQRMGGNKALMDYQGQPWILAQLQQLTEVGFQSITIVTNAESEAALEKLVENHSAPVLILTNPHPEQGPFSSLQLAIAATPEDTSFVSPVDVPLKAATLKKLRQAWLQHGHLDALIPSHQDMKGHPVILSVDLQRNLLQLSPDSPEARLDFILRALPENKKRIFNVEDPFVHMNLNTPEDLAALAR